MPVHISDTNWVVYYIHYLCELLCCFASSLTVMHAQAFSTRAVHCLCASQEKIPWKMSAAGALRSISCVNVHWMFNAEVIH